MSTAWLSLRTARVTCLGEDSHILGSCLRELCGPSPVALNHSPYPLWYFQQLTLLINSTFIRQAACLLPQTNTWNFLAKKTPNWLNAMLNSFLLGMALHVPVLGRVVIAAPSSKSHPCPNRAWGSLVPLVGRCLLVLRMEAGVPGSIPWQHCPKSRRLGPALSPTADNSSHGTGKGEERSPMSPWSTCMAGSSTKRSIRCASCACFLWLHCLCAFLYTSLSLQQPGERN